MESVISHDGVKIAYDKRGDGPPVILVASALATRAEVNKLAGLLAAHFSVLNYDRRGRGDSGDAPLYEVAREVADIEALIDAHGGSAYLFGSSSGAVLALEAAAALPHKVKKAILFEPPFILDDSRPPMPADFGMQLGALVAAGKGQAAVRRFFTTGLGIPPVAVTLMRWLMPMWGKMVKIAHTLPYDFKIMEGTQAGKPLPAGRWSAQAAILVLTGGKSESFFQSGAQALVAALPNARHHILDGVGHGAPVMSPAKLLPHLRAFFDGDGASLSVSPSKEKIA